MTSAKTARATKASENAPERRFSRGGVAIATMIACAFGYGSASVLQSSASTAAAAVNDLVLEAVAKSARSAQSDPADVHQLYVEVNRIKQENAFLRSELEALTDQGGIVDKLIAHVRQLQQSDRDLMELVRPTATGTEITANTEPSAPASAILVRHEVVTPRAATAAENPPIPASRPDKRQGADAKSDPLAKGD